MAELAFLSAIISAITTFGKMIYDEIKKAHEEARVKITETKETILLIVSGEACLPRNFSEEAEGFRTTDRFNFKQK
jgi:predicted regulator of Ras-like GTPase activity (Roadblock/LC7/MglB family)